MKANFSYGRKEKLKSRKVFDQLFAKGNNFRHYPLRLYFSCDRITGSEELVQVGVGAPTRSFKKAVDRNRIKRQLREAYRLQKHILHEYCTQNQKALALFILYTGKELPESSMLAEKLNRALYKLLQLLDEAPQTNS